MSGWPVVALGDLMVKKAPSIDPKKHPDDSFALYSIPAFDAGAPEKVCGREIGSTKKLAQPGDIMLSRIVPHIRRACVVQPHDEDHIAASSEWIAFRSPQVDPSYLRHTLVGDPFHAQFMQTVAGVGGSLLRARPQAVARIEVPLPPIAEQERIAAILDQADALRRRRRDALALLDTLTQSVFVEMFGDPVSNPMGWQTKPIGDAVEHISDGPFGSKLKSSHYTDDGVRIVRLQNVGAGKFVDDDQAYVSPEHAAGLSKHLCKPGDILIGSLGDPNLRACVLPDHITMAINKADCFQVRVDGQELLTDYFVNMINHPSTLKAAEGLVLGQTRGRISMGRLKGLVVPVPSADVQRRFGEEAKAIAEQRSAAASAVAHLHSLFASLQSRAFAGDL